MRDTLRSGRKPSGKASVATSYALLGLLTTCFVLSYVDRQVISILVDPMKASLSLSDGQFGLLQGVSFSIFYVLASLPLAQLSDSYSRPKIMAACVTVWSVMSMACGLSRNFWELLLARIGVASGEAGLPPAALSMMSDRFDYQRLARATAIFMVAPFVGGGLALLWGGALYAHLQETDLLGVQASFGLEPWQVVFLLIALPGFVAAAPLLFIRDKRSQVVESEREQTSLKALMKVMHERRAFFLAYILAISFTALIMGAYVSWLPAAVMRSKDVDAARLGALFGPIFMIAGSLGTLSAGYIASLGKNDFVRHTLTIMRVYAVCLLPLAIAGPLVPSFYAELAIMGVAIFLISSIVGLSSLPLQIAVPTRMRARSIAVLGLSCALIGTGLGPLITGYLADALTVFQHSLSVSLAAVGGIFSLLVIVLIGMAKHGYRMPVQTSEEVF